MLRNILKVRRTLENIREIVTIDDKVVLARCITSEDYTMLDIDVVEKIENLENIIETKTIDNRKILLIKLRDNVLGLVYETDDVRELISLKVLLDKALSDDELLEVFENTLRDLAPTYYEKISRILKKYYKDSLT
ncbi:MAG: hypothetical protein GXO10_07785 [Crenarchaeota archaeon]|nr:hypothetical protein [Thermoproteota archaeon]